MRVAAWFQMKKTIHLLFCFLLAMYAPFAWSTDACSTRSIIGAADVSVSDGSSFKVETFFHSKDAAAIRHIRDEERLIVVEGPTSWTRTADKDEPGTSFHKRFSLGHQFHAFLLHFENMVGDVRPVPNIDFHSGVHSGVSGNDPYGGTISLIDSNDETRPAGLLFEFPETPPITVIFADWREIDGEVLPYHIQIDDGERIFDYHYSAIDLTSKSPLWFFEQIDAPVIDQVQIYRLHRKLLAAHCLGDADLMSTLSAPEVLVANRGELQQYQNDAMRERFADLFNNLNYAEYHDLVMPAVEVSAASDIGWISVNVRAIGSERKSGVPFDDQWAWVMLARKIDNVWVHAGNASNRVLR